VWDGDDHKRPTLSTSWPGFTADLLSPETGEATKAATRADYVKAREQFDRGREASSAPASPRPGVTGLTESFAMTPPSSVSGLYFSHPQSPYSGVKIAGDQVADYAPRKGWPLSKAERWLSPIMDGRA